MTRRIKAWRQDEALRRGVGLQAVLPTPVLETIVRDPPHDAEEFEHLPRMGKRRAERYSETLLKFLGRSAPVIMFIADAGCVW